MVAGFGIEPFTSFTDPSITTVDQKSIPMGQVTAETFFKLLNGDKKNGGPQKTVLKPELMIWQSTQKNYLKNKAFCYFPRHEYFRRILCNLIGKDVANGELPADEKWLGKIVSDISYYNAKAYFNF